MYLLTGPHTGPIPGLFRAGRAAMAEELEWDQQDFDKAFQELLALGMVKADWKARLVWLPKAIECNRPESPNVVLSWTAEWEFLPECDLKQEAFKVLKANVEAVGPAFSMAFGKAFSKPFAKPSAKTCPNQEQEQEQEQDKENQNLSASGDAAQVEEEPFYLTKKKRKLKGRRLECFERFWKAFGYKNGKAEAADAWLDLPKMLPSDYERIIAAAAEESLRRPGMVASGRSPKMAQGWLSGRRWEDEESCLPALAVSGSDPFGGSI
jgi:hypothetical protein